MPAVVDIEKCDGCGTCKENCPTDAVSIENGKAQVKPDDCIDCNLCESNCDQKAIQMA